MCQQHFSSLGLRVELCPSTNFIIPTIFQDIWNRLKISPSQALLSLTMIADKFQISYIKNGNEGGITSFYPDYCIDPKEDDKYKGVIYYE